MAGELEKLAAVVGIALTVASLVGIAISVGIYIGSLKNEVASCHQRISNMADLLEIKLSGIAKELDTKIEINTDHIHRHCTYLTHIQQFLESTTHYQPSVKS